MTKGERGKLFNELKMLAAILNADVTKEVIQAYVEILAVYDFEKCKRSIKWAATSCRFFPKPVELIDQINPKPTREDGSHLAGLAIECIKKFGIHQASLAKEYMGDEAWGAVQMAGGWSLMCNTPNDQIGTMRAQLRENAMVSAGRDSYRKRSEKRISHALARQLGIDDPNIAADREALNQHDFEKKKEAVLLDFKKHIESKGDQH